MSGLLATLPLHLACQLLNSHSYYHGNVTITEDSPAPIYAKDLPEGYTVFPNIGLAYKYYKNRLTWNEARKQCIAEGANLAIVDSFQKIQYLMGIQVLAVGLHTGIHRLCVGTGWSSSKSGQPLVFIPWKPDANLNAGTGQCVAMWYDGSGVGPFNCNTPLPSVCEIPLFEGPRSGPQPPERLDSSIIPNCVTGK